MKGSSTKAGDLERIYRNRLDADAAYRLRVWKTLVDKFFSRYIASNAVVLDLGCGHGEFINNVECGKKLAIDLNRDSRRHLNPDVVFLEQDGSEPWDIADATLDVVFSSNFFEHLPSKETLSDILAQTWRCLRPGGFLIAMGPNIRFVRGGYWDFWDHHLPLTDSSVVEILRMHGFRIDRVIDRFLPYTMVNARQVPAALISAYLKLPPVWKIFGKQFLIVAGKPALSA
jgi:SAM-dependent methyltransferase